MKNCPMCGSEDFVILFYGVACGNDKCVNYKPPKEDKNSQKISEVQQNNNLSNSTAQTNTPKTKFSFNITSTNNSFFLANDIQTQKQIAEHCINEINKSTVEPSVIIGGAPRNWYFNKLANDIDIYVPIMSRCQVEDNIKNCSNFKLYSNKTPKHQSSVIYDVKSYYYELNNIRIVLDVIFCNFNRGDVNANPNSSSTTKQINFFEKVVETYDFGICKIGIHDDLFSWITDRHFHDNCNNNWLSIRNINSLHPKQLSMLGKRVEKMKKLFPGWNMRIES